MRLRMWGDVRLEYWEEAARVNEGAEGPNKLYSDKKVWARRSRRLDKGVDEGDGVVCSLQHDVVLDCVLPRVVKGG